MEPSGWVTVHRMPLSAGCFGFLFRSALDAGASEPPPESGSAMAILAVSCGFELAT